MKCSPDQEQRGRSMFKIFVPCCLGSTISSQVAARYELVQTPFCLRGRNTWNFRDPCDFTARSSNAGCIPEGPSNQSLNLISCWYHPAPVRVFGVTEKDHAASAVRLVAGPRCSSRQPSLCRWSRFLQHSQPLVLLLGLFASLEFHSKFFLSPQSRSFLASLRPTRKVLARASVWHARTKRTEDFSIHVPLCLDSLSLALPGPLPLLCLRWCLN